MAAAAARCDRCSSTARAGRCPAGRADAVALPDGGRGGIGRRGSRSIAATAHAPLLAVWGSGRGAGGAPLALAQRSAGGGRGRCGGGRAARSESRGQLARLQGGAGDGRTMIDVRSMATGQCCRCGQNVDGL